MKNLIILFILVTLCSFNSIGQNSNTSETQITLISFGELGECKFVLTSKSFQEFKRAGNRSDSSFQNLDNGDWYPIMEILNEIKLDSLNYFEAPTNERHTDGDWYSHIVIVKNSIIYRSLDYDASTPNNNLKQLDSIIYKTSKKYSKIKWENLYQKSKRDEIKKRKGRTEDIYTLVDIMPEFPGGEDALKDFIRDKLNDHKIEGKTYIQFIVEENGRLKNITALQSENDSIKHIALEIVEKMPKWSPGIYRGSLVKVRVILPIEYKK